LVSFAVDFVLHVCGLLPWLGLFLLFLFFFFNVPPNVGNSRSLVSRLVFGLRESPNSCANILCPFTNGKPPSLFSRHFMKLPPPTPRLGRLLGHCLASKPQHFFPKRFGSSKSLFCFRCQAGGHFSPKRFPTCFAYLPGASPCGPRGQPCPLPMNHIPLLPN